MAVDEELSLTERLHRRIQSFHDLIGLDSKLLSDAERLNVSAMYRIYEGKTLPEMDDWAGRGGGESAGHYAAPAHPGGGPGAVANDYRAARRDPVGLAGAHAAAHGIERPLRTEPGVNGVDKVGRVGGRLLTNGD